MHSDTAVPEIARMLVSNEDEILRDIISTFDLIGLLVKVD